LNEIAKSAVKKEAGLCIVGQLPNGVFKGGVWIKQCRKIETTKKTSAAFTANPVLRAFNNLKEKRDYFD